MKVTFTESEKQRIPDELRSMFEFQVVDRVTRESDDCYLVEFESGFACGFPPDHDVDIDEEQGV